MIKTELLQYDIRHDWEERDVNFISEQLETHLKERFNVLLSTVNYGIDNGHLVRKGTKEPFVNSIERGRDFIHLLSGSNDVDYAREEAEIIGFRKIDSYFSDPNTPLGSIMLSISPQGERDSKYQHNFYDIFTLKKINGEKYVELSRYSSALNRSEYAKKLGLDFKNPPGAEDFLSNPIDCGSQLTAEKLHKLLHKEHEYISPKEFLEKIWNTPCLQFFKERYISQRLPERFNALLNAADEALTNLKRDALTQISGWINTPSSEKIRYLEEKKVRQAGGGCPGKSGADINDSPFSVSIFGLGEGDFGYEFNLDGPCKNCNADVKCGPCGICRLCDLKIRAERKPSLN